MEKHVDESVGVRTKVDTDAEKVLTLERAQESHMQDIRDIKKGLEKMADAVVSIEKEQIKIGRDVKIWILGGMVAGILALAVSIICGLIAIGEYKNMIQGNGERIKAIEDLHPRIVSPTRGEPDGRSRDSQ